MGGGGGSDSGGGSSQPSGVTIRGGRMRGGRATSRPSTPRQNETDAMSQPMAGRGGTTYATTQKRQTRDFTSGIGYGEAQVDPALAAAAGFYTGGKGGSAKVSRANESGLGLEQRVSESGKKYVVSVDRQTGKVVKSYNTEKGGLAGELPDEDAPEMQATPEDAPEDTGQGTLMTPTSKTRRTRSKRFGGASDLSEGILIKAKR